MTITNQLRNIIVLKIAIISSIINVSTLAEGYTLTPEDKSRIEALRACDKALNACDEALGKADKVIKDKNAIIDIRDKQVKELAGENASLKTQRDSLLRSPLFWFVVGLAAGGATYGFIQKGH